MELREDVKAGEGQTIGKLLGVEGECSKRDIAEAIRVTRSLTKRDLFAAMAMQGFMAYPEADGGGTTIKEFARLSVKAADALLIELAKETGA